VTDNRYHISSNFLEINYLSESLNYDLQHLDHYLLPLGYKKSWIEKVSMVYEDLKRLSPNLDIFSLSNFLLLELYFHESKFAILRIFTTLTQINSIIFLSIFNRTFDYIFVIK